MKRLALSIILLSLSLNAYCGSLETITEKSVKTFIELMPEYKTLDKAFYQNSNKPQDQNAINEAQKSYNDLQSLFQKYGTDIQEFSTFLQRIAMAISVLKMEEQKDILKDTQIPEGMTMPQIPELPKIPEQEMKVIKQNISVLEKLLDF